MSLVANLQSFAFRVGQEIKEVRAEIAAGGGGGGGGSGPAYVPAGASYQAGDANTAGNISFNASEVANVSQIIINATSLNQYDIGAALNDVNASGNEAILEVVDSSNTQVKALFSVSTTAVDAEPSDPGVYRGFRAFYKSLSGDDPSVQNIIFYKENTDANLGLLDGDTDSEDFSVSNLSGSDVVALLNVYGNNSDAPISLTVLQAGAIKFIDNVLYTGDTLSTAQQAKDNFYNNISELQLPYDGLYNLDDVDLNDNNINDGGSDQYDTGNFISTDLDSQFNYGGGDVVTGSTAFGANSSYVSMYQDGLFAMFAEGVEISSFSVTGETGSDGDGVEVAGVLELSGTAPSSGYEPQSVLTLNASFVEGNDGLPLDGSYIINIDHSRTPVKLPYVRLTATATPIVSFGESVSFAKPDYQTETVDNIGPGVAIARGNNQGLYNPLVDANYNASNNGPTHTQWNNQGWSNLSNVTTRTYESWESAVNGNPPNSIGQELVMHDTLNDKYYKVMFSGWTQNNNGGGFAYTREEIVISYSQTGIRFTDGTVQNTAYPGDTSTKLAFTDWKIVDVSGSNTFTFAPQQNLTENHSTVSSSGDVLTPRTVTTVQAGTDVNFIAMPKGSIFEDGWIWEDPNFQVKLNGVEIGPYIGGSSVGNENFDRLQTSIPVTYNAGDTVEYTLRTYSANNTMMFGHPNTFNFDRNWIFNAMDNGTANIEINGNQHTIVGIGTYGDGENERVSIQITPEASFGNNYSVNIPYRTPFQPQPWLLPLRDFALGSANLRGYKIDYHYYSPSYGTGIGSITYAGDTYNANVIQVNAVSGKSGNYSNDVIIADWDRYINGAGWRNHKALFGYNTDNVNEPVKIHWSGKAFYSSDSND